MRQFCYRADKIMMSEGPEPYSMLDWATVESAKVGNNEFVLARHGENWVVRVDQRILMSNRINQSEIALAEETLDRVPDARSILVGGLGLGYTLRAALDIAHEEAHVTVVELVGELVDWNRRLIGHLNDAPLDDPRCEVVVGDAFELIHKARAQYDVIMLDVDNGPQALSQVKNQRLYGDVGVRACWNALMPGGVLGVWGNGPNAKYAARMERFGFHVEVLGVQASFGSRAVHTLFLGTRS